MEHNIENILKLIDKMTERAIKTAAQQIKDGNYNEYKRTSAIIDAYDSIVEIIRDVDMFDYLVKCNFGGDEQ